MRRRKLLPDGTFGPMEDVFGEPTPDEQIVSLESMNAELMYNVMISESNFEEMKNSQSELMYQLMMKGVI